MELNRDTSLFRPSTNESLYKMKASIKEEEISKIRNHTRNGRLIGSESFIEKMERKFDRIFKLRPRGRPKKGKGQ